MTPTSNEARPEEIIWLSGQPRHDALLRCAFPGRRVILVMDPTTTIPVDDSKRADLSLMLRPGGFCHVLKDRKGYNNSTPLVSWWTSSAEAIQALLGRDLERSVKLAREWDRIISLRPVKGFAVCA